jgi:short-subunit dehydrogenase
VSGDRKHAVVVGASSGIGAAIAARLDGASYSVSSLCRRAPRHPCDATQPGQIASAMGDAIGVAGPVDLLVYSAGAPAMGVTTAVPVERAREAFEVGFWALDEAVRAALPTLVERRGAILAVLSLAALRGIPYEAYYAAAKAAAARYLDCLAHEVEPRGVRVRYVCPGFVDTGFAERAEWYGLPAVPKINGSGVSADDVARIALATLEARPRSRVIGWRERVITLADRAFPELYDRWLSLRH